MAHKFAEITFTESVQNYQEEYGSRAGCSAWESRDDFNNILGQREAEFIAQRDSFYMASVSETGWPYVQHRGGPAGFMKVIDEQTIGFADFRGNRQYVSLGNFRKDDRVALFFMDYANRMRLKMLGRIRLIDAHESALKNKLEEQLQDSNYEAQTERHFVIQVEVFDWNCPQHITPRYTQAQINSILEPLRTENENLKAGQDASTLSSIEVLGDGPLELIVSGVRQLTPRIRSYEFRDPNGLPLPAVSAGSHLQIPVLMDDGKTELHHYSICSNPSRRDIYEIAVLREDEGGGGSVSTHKNLNIGTRLNCELPENNFPLDAERPAVLIAGGIGITAIKATAHSLMTHSLSESSATFQLHYAGRKNEELAFREDLLADFKSDLILCRSDQNEYLDLKQIFEGASRDAKFYICGPGQLIDAAVNIANSLAIDPKRIRFERFAADTGLDAKPFAVELKRSGVSIHVPADKSILNAVIDAGIEAPYSCKAGNCRSCAVKVIEGEVEHRDSALSPMDRADQQLICLCVSRARGENLILDI